MFRLFLDVECVRSIHLHPVSQFKGLDTRFHLGVLRATAGMLFVEDMKEVQLLPLSVEYCQWPWVVSAFAVMATPASKIFFIVSPQ